MKDAGPKAKAKRLENNAKKADELRWARERYNARENETQAQREQFGPDRSS
jgi:hypothetical protein